MKKYISIFLLLIIFSCGVFAASNLTGKTPKVTKKYDMFDISPITSGTVTELPAFPTNVDYLEHPPLNLDEEAIKELIEDFAAANPDVFDSASLTLQEGWKSWSNLEPAEPFFQDEYDIYFPEELGVTPYGRTFVKMPAVRVHIYNPIKYAIAYENPNISSYINVGDVLQISMAQYGKLVSNGALTNVFIKRDKYGKRFRLILRFSLMGEPVTLNDNLSFVPIDGMYVIGQGEVEFIRQTYTANPSLFHNLSAEVIE